MEDTEKELKEDNAGKFGDEDVVGVRKEKLIKFLKTKYNWISYLILALIAFLAYRMRTRNLGGLRDITTGSWTLGPDLDPWLFTRWAEYIVEHGKLMVVDVMRYVPRGFETKAELILHPYLIAWFHKAVFALGISESVINSAVLYPAFMFALTVIAFFLMTRKIFTKKLGEKSSNAIALVASFFLTVFPSLLPRTIAGIPEKESSAFLFMFLAFYFFLCAWEAKSNYRYLFALLSGISTAAMALVWGGFTFLFLTITPAIFVSFLAGKVGKKELGIYSIWMLSSFFIMNIFSLRYSIKDLLTSIDTGSAVLVLFVIISYFIMFKTNLKSYFESDRFNKIPKTYIATIVSLVVIFIVASILFGVSFIPSKISFVINNLVNPSSNRLLVTVAENRQPYFVEWANSFGPAIRNIPITFWLFFIGSVYLFNEFLRPLNKKDNFALTLSYVIFIFSLIFSRYSASSYLNGTNGVSLIFYGFGFLQFIGVVGYYHYHYLKHGEEARLKEIDFNFLFVFTLFFLSIVAARSSVRTVMVLVPVASIIIAYFMISVLAKAIKQKGSDTKRAAAWIIAATIMISSIYAGYVYYKVSLVSAEQYAPSIYNQQWQRAMAWVRDNTNENAVFGHWWDYGYWIQSIGKRATILDGGNAFSYWNHLMGRHALTGTSNKDALEFLYAHNTTHFLIDSTDIGKYTAFSSIGSDVNYDRASYVPTILKDPNTFQEGKNSTAYLYRAGVVLDSDVIYERNGEKLFLPAGQGALAGVLVERGTEGELRQPTGIFIYQGKQINLPLKYSYDAFDGKFSDYNNGVEAGIFLFPSAVQTAGGISLDKDGAMLYLSQRTVKSQLARLYLYKEENPYFKLAHSEDDFVVNEVKKQSAGFVSDFIYYNGFRGPIRIWEIKYPDDIEFKEEYLSIDYPPELLSVR